MVYPSSDGGGCSILAVSLENLSLTANRTSLSVSVRVRSKARIVPAWSVRIILPYREEHIIKREDKCVVQSTKPEGDMIDTCVVCGILQRVVSFGKFFSRSNVYLHYVVYANLTN